VSTVGGLDVHPLVMILLMQAVILLLGCFIDTISIMLVSIPIFMPIVVVMGIDPIWFSILILIQLELAGITPPFGVLLFVMKGVQQHLRISEIYKAAMPIVLIQFLLIAILMIFPSIVSFLPGLAK
jgi:TRAP-type C4-dicarboxylate transport system permease large subunit